MRKNAVQRIVAGLLLLLLLTGCQSAPATQENTKSPTKTAQTTQTTEVTEAPAETEVTEEPEATETEVGIATEATESAPAQPEQAVQAPAPASPAPAPEPATPTAQPQPPAEPQSAAPTEAPTEPPAQPQTWSIAGAQIAEIEAYGNAYAQSLGATIDYSMTTGNSGYATPGTIYDASVMDMDSYKRIAASNVDAIYYNLQWATGGNMEGLRMRVLVIMDSSDPNYPNRMDIYVLYG